MRKSIYSILREKLIQNINKVLIERLEDGQWKSYKVKEIIQKVDTLSAFLKSNGMNPGYRVGIFIDASPEWIIAALAIWKAKGTAVLLSSMVTAEENMYQIRLTDLSAVITTCDLHDKFSSHFPNEVALIKICETFQFIDNPGRPSYIHSPNINDGDEDIAVLVLTSGTTGNVKVVQLEHKSLISQATNELLLAHYKDTSPLFSVLPYFHIYPLVSNVLLSLYSEFTLIQLDELNLENIIRAFQEKKPRSLITTPRLLEAMYVKMKVRMSEMSPSALKRTCHLLRFSYWLHSKLGISIVGRTIFKRVYNAFGGRMRNITCGGAPLDPFLMQFYESCGLKIHIGYGLSETTGPITYADNNSRIPGAVGKHIPRVEVKLFNIDENGDGEIAAKGNVIMRDYFRNKKATDDVFQDGFFKTGDVGRFDKKGNLFITGRIKELIVSPTGKKTSPIEVEKYFINLPHTQESAVLGVKAKDGSGDETWIAIVLKDNLDEISVEQAKALIRKEIKTRNKELTTRLKVQNIHFATELPKTNLQKVKRTVLAELIMKNRDMEFMAKPEMKHFEGDNIEHELVKILHNVNHYIHDNVDENMHLSEFGMDSLMALQFYNILQERFPNKVKTEWIYADPTIIQLTEAIKTGKDDFMITNNKKKEDNPYWFKGYRWRRHTEHPKQLSAPLATANILLTGATGVLGGHILFSLLKESSSKIYCLLRKNEKLDGLERIKHILQVYKMDYDFLKASENRIIITYGDVSKPKLGLSDQDYKELTRHIDLSIHCAAKVSLHGVYEDVAGVNVIGTSNMIQFALDTKQEYLMYVSSYSAFGNATHVLNKPLTEADMDVGQSFTNLGYQQSKFESEILVRAAGSKGLKWNIVRPGDIYGDSQSGAYPLGATTVSGIYYDMMRTVLETATAANANIFYDITPVDYVSRAIVMLTLRHNHIYGTYHLKNPVVIRFNELMEALKNLGLSIDLVDPDIYKQKLMNNELRTANDKPYSSPSIELLKLRPDGFLKEQQTYVDSSYTYRIMMKNGIQCAPPSLELLQKYFNYCIDINFFKAEMFIGNK
ncbi:MAG: thioester reductase domain-containing protein [Hyphomicrobiales bacterium]